MKLRTYTVESQCPDGHFCFHHGPSRRRRASHYVSQCPDGHFCFHHSGMGQVQSQSACQHHESMP